jgi:hypothetical protein
MKQQIKNKTWLLCLAFLPLLASNCKKEKTKTPEDYVVHQGRQAFGAYLNGQPWVADYRDAGINFGPLQLGFYYSSFNRYFYAWFQDFKANEEISIFLPPPLGARKSFVK